MGRRSCLALNRTRPSSRWTTPTCSARHRSPTRWPTSRRWSTSPSAPTYDQAPPLDDLGLDAPVLVDEFTPSEPEPEPEPITFDEPDLEPAVSDFAEPEPEPAAGGCGRRRLTDDLGLT